MASLKKAYEGNYNGVYEGQLELQRVQMFKADMKVLLALMRRLAESYPSVGKSGDEDPFRSFAFFNLAPLLAPQVDHLQRWIDRQF